MAKHSIRILSYNIHKGFSPLNRKYVIDEIKSAIRLVNADVLLLQDVVGENKSHDVSCHEWHENCQLEYLSESFWNYALYGKNDTYELGHHGNAILSKQPLIKKENIDITFMQNPSRGILCGELDNNLQLLSTHFGLSLKEQKHQAQILSQKVDTLLDNSVPFILAGDFNDYSLSTHKTLMKKSKLTECFEKHTGKLSKTFPSIFPILPFDRIYMSGMTVVDCKRLSGKPWNLLSDHCALYVELQF